MITLSDPCAFAVLSRGSQEPVIPDLVGRRCLMRPESLLKLTILPLSSTKTYDGPFSVPFICLPALNLSALPQFRETLRKQPFDEKIAVQTYTELIGRLPVPNKYLLLYVLDLLSVFEKKADKNLMTATSGLLLASFLTSVGRHSLTHLKHRSRGHLPAGYSFPPGSSDAPARART